MEWSSAADRLKRVAQVASGGSVHAMVSIFTLLDALESGNAHKPLWNETNCSQEWKVEKSTETELSNGLFSFYSYLTESTDNAYTNSF